MTRVEQCFANLRAAGEGALVCFVVAGDPDMETTRRTVLDLERAGADIVELGVPFSDPIADGPTIQAASMRALKAGATVSRVLDLVRSLRQESEVPIVLMTYYNPILKYGLQRFACDAASAGVDGVIVTDLTPEEAGPWKACADQAALNTIFLLAPTSTLQRIERVASLASGFIYCVSRTGVTGARPEMAEGLRELIQLIRSKTNTPIAVGFGISRPEHVREVCELAEGAVVGSALIDLASRRCEMGEFSQRLRSQVSELKSGTRPSGVP